MKILFQFFNVNVLTYDFVCAILIIVQTRVWRLNRKCLSYEILNEYAHVDQTVAMACKRRIE